MRGAWAFRLPRLSLNSLAARMVITAAVWTVIGLVAGGFILSGVFRSAVQNDFDARLSSDLGGMIAVAAPEADGGVSLQGRFSDPRFARVYSGWYWQIVPEVSGKPAPDQAQISRSLFDRTIKITETDPPGAGKDPRLFGYGLGPEGQRVRFVERRVTFPILSTVDLNDTRSYVFLVAGNVREVEAEVASFNRLLAWSFAALGAALIAVVFIQMRVVLLPLRRLQGALARIRDGKARRLEGQFPAEITPLASELNGLIAHSAEVVGRARTHVSNLAHALKTPLSVLASEAEAHPGPAGDAVMRQVEAMRRHVDHYLIRARAAGALDVLGTRTPLAEPLEGLARVLRRIHAARDIAIDIACPPDLAFRGEKQDLEEMAGNLMDNACKWARSRVRVEAHALAGGKLRITVGDDGPGLTDDERARVGERGERLDESVPGSGLGLAIVRDIAKLYGGALDLGTSELGGLETRLTLPAAG